MTPSRCCRKTWLGLARSRGQESGKRLSVLPFGRAPSLASPPPRREQLPGEASAPHLPLHSRPRAQRNPAQLSLGSSRSSPCRMKPRSGCGRVLPQQGWACRFTLGGGLHRPEQACRRGVAFSKQGGGNKKQKEPRPLWGELQGSLGLAAPRGPSVLDPSTQQSGHRIDIQQQTENTENGATSVSSLPPRQSFTLK